MKVLAITQARYGSTRLPAKILKTINDKTLLELHLQRILQSKYIDKLKVATTNEEGSKFIIEIASKFGIECYQGSLNDVLDRFYQTALSEKPDYVVRLTSDCPLIDASIIDTAIGLTINGGFDYVSTGGKFPDGTDVEVFSFAALEKAHKEAQLNSEREHVTPYIWKNGSYKGGKLFNSIELPTSRDYSSYRLTIDEKEDFELIKTLIERIGDDKNWKEYVDYLDTHLELKEINNKHSRNEGYTKSINND